LNKCWMLKPLFLSCHGAPFFKKYLFWVCPIWQPLFSIFL
jgi:hypothetical protein